MVYGRFITVVLVILGLSSMSANAQVKKLLQEGNKLYEQKKYAAATNNYLKALQKDPNNTAGMFNLGNALYQKQSFDSSRKIMKTTAEMLKDKNGKAAANYNIGNSYMAEKKWEDAVTAYKQALRNNPQDADAKYNLAYAQQMLKKQNGGGGKNQDKNKDKQQQQQQQQDKKENDKKDKQDQQQQQQQDKNDKDDKQDKQPQSQPSKLTKEQADQLLNALQQEEKKLQDKMKKEKGVPMKLQKDW